MTNYELRIETLAKVAEHPFGTPSIARQVAQEAAASCRAMLGVPVLQRSRIANSTFEIRNSKFGRRQLLALCHAGGQMR
jgi:hypothetical protein